MNSRIRELAEQAGYHPDVFELCKPGLAKFAESIVEEMYDFIMEESANDNGIPDLGKVKQHFGVEQ